MRRRRGEREVEVVARVEEKLLLSKGDDGLGMDTCRKSSRRMGTKVMGFAWPMCLQETYRRVYYGLVGKFRHTRTG